MDYESVNEKASGETILIVDDVEPNRLILGEIIKDMGCNPVLAESWNWQKSIIPSWS